jgi:CheY-like chemotaxis protein
MAASRTILFADDEQTDFILFRVALQNAGLGHYLAHVADGQEAIDYLSGQVPYADRTQYPFPDLLLLDLKMPRLTGFDVLKWLQTRPELSKLPVVVLSSSEHADDLAESRRLGAQDFHPKPLDVPGLVKLAHELDRRWLSADAVSRPGGAAAPRIPSARLGGRARHRKP